MFKKLALLVGMSLLASCAAFQAGTSEKKLEKRVVARLEALQAADFKKAYTYMSPGYREMNHPAVFEADHVGLVGMKEFRVVSTSCETEDSCQVTVEIVVNLSALAPGFKSDSPMVTDMAYRERWIKIDGQWWYVKLG